MRVSDDQPIFGFSYVSCEARVPPGDRLRLIRAVVDEALEMMSAEFDGLYDRPPWSGPICMLVHYGLWHHV